MHSTHIPLSITKKITGCFWSYIGHFVNIYIDQGTFVSIIKYVNITLVFKKQKFERKLPLGSYSSCHLQNLYQTFIQRNGTFHGSIFLAIQWWLLQVVQWSVFPLAMLKKLKRAGAPEEWIYGFNLSALNLTQNYLASRKQRTKNKVLYGIPNVCILCLPFLKIIVLFDICI